MVPYVVNRKLLFDSWKEVGGKVVSGIGGLVKSINGCHVLEFSGPSKTANALQAEEHALLQMVELLTNSR